MFNVTGGELVIVLLAALVVLGPERLPEAARTVGKLMAQLRDVSQGFQKELKSALDEVGEPLQGLTRPQLTALDGGAKPDQTDKPKSAEMYSAVPATTNGAGPDAASGSTARPVLPSEPHLDGRVDAAASVPEVAFERSDSQGDEVPIGPSAPDSRPALDAGPTPDPRPAPGAGPTRDAGPTPDPRPAPDAGPAPTAAPSSGDGPGNGAGSSPGRAEGPDAPVAPGLVASGPASADPPTMTNGASRTGDGGREDS